jgi:hypothetical protein
MQIEDLIKALEGASKEQINFLAKELDKTAPVKRAKHTKYHTGVKTYTTIIKKYKCLCCEHEWTREYKLNAGEQITTTDPMGIVYIITSTGKVGELEVPCSVSKCSNCHKAVSTWSRWELEQKFMLLLKSCEFKEVGNYATSTQQELKTPIKHSMVVYEAKL